MEDNYGAQWTYRWREKAEADQSRSPEEKAEAFNREMEFSMRLWGQALAGLTKEEMRRGIDTCVRTMDRPPNKAQFIRASGHQEKPQGAAYRVNEAYLLPKPTPDPKVAAMRLARMRYALNPLRYCNRWQQVHGMRRWV